jgi:hypothetical protein
MESLYVVVPSAVARHSALLADCCKGADDIRNSDYPSRNRTNRRRLVPAQVVTI